MEKSEIYLFQTDRQMNILQTRWTNRITETVLVCEPFSVAVVWFYVRRVKINLSDFYRYHFTNWKFALGLPKENRFDKKKISEFTIRIFWLIRIWTNNRLKKNDPDLISVSIELFIFNNPLVVFFLLFTVCDKGLLHDIKVICRLKICF